MARRATTPTQRFFRALNRAVIPALRAGIGTPWFGPGLYLVETTGRVSGEPRPVPLLGYRFGRQVVVSTVRADSQWVRNLEAEPSATLWLDGAPRSASAAVRRCGVGPSVAVIDAATAPT